MFTSFLEGESDGRLGQQVGPGLATQDSHSGKGHSPL